MPYYKATYQDSDQAHEAYYEAPSEDRCRDAVRVAASVDLPDDRISLEEVEDPPHGILAILA